MLARNGDARAAFHADQELGGDEVEVDLRISAAGFEVSKDNSQPPSRFESVSGAVFEFVMSTDRAALRPFDLFFPSGAAATNVRSTPPRIVGREVVDGVPCFHLSVPGEGQDEELWIDEREMLLRRSVSIEPANGYRPIIITTTVRYEPQLDADLSSPSDADFVR